MSNLDVRPSLIHVDENDSFPYGSGRQSDIVLVLHDAFQDLRSVQFLYSPKSCLTVLGCCCDSYWKGFQADSDHQGVAMDKHIYQMFDTQVRSLYILPAICSR